MSPTSIIRSEQILKPDEERTRICRRNVAASPSSQSCLLPLAPSECFEHMSMTTAVAIPERTTSSRIRLLAVLFLGFVLSGIATTIIGPMLPVFIRRGGLDDGQAGLFPELQFFASLLRPLPATPLMASPPNRPPLTLP